MNNDDIDTATMVSITDDDGNLLDKDGDILYCNACGCEAPAQERVAVSCYNPHDGIRDYCLTCYEVYMVGVQHGRYHEAARYNKKPGRDSSQEKPNRINKN